MIFVNVVRVGVVVLVFAAVLSMVVSAAEVVAVVVASDAVPLVVAAVIEFVVFISCA